MQVTLRNTFDFVVASYTSINAERWIFSTLEVREMAVSTMKTVLSSMRRCAWSRLPLYVANNGMHSKNTLKASAAY